MEVRCLQPAECRKVDTLRLPWPCPRGLCHTLSGCVAVVLLAGGILPLLGELWQTLFSYYAAPTEWWLAALALIGLGVLLGRSSQPSKTFPKCAETIRGEAKVCRHSGHSLEEANLPAPSKFWRRPSATRLVIPTDARTYAAQQLDGANPVSRAFGFGAILASGWPGGSARGR